MLSLQSPSSNAEALGHAIGLMALSDVHRGYNLEQFVRLTYPPITLDQCLFFTRNRDYVGFLSWALMGEEAQKRFLNDDVRRLMPGDWNSGRNFWIVDIVAPYGDMPQMARIAREHLVQREDYKDMDELRFIRTYGTGAIVRTGRIVR